MIVVNASSFRSLVGLADLFSSGAVGLDTRRRKNRTLLLCRAIVHDLIHLPHCSG